MVTPDPISEWSQDEISSWINGLDIGLDRYKESLKYLTGDQLLTAKYTDLYQYGIDKGSVQTFFPDFFFGHFLPQIFTAFPTIVLKNSWQKPTKMTLFYGHGFLRVLHPEKF